MLKFGLVGCGRIAKNHFEALAGSDAASFTCCCDIDQERAITAARQYNIERVYTDYRQMLATEQMDAVSICTPSGLHPQVGIDAARRGIHVVSEKPMATTLAAADELINTCEEQGVKLFVVKQNRLIPPMQLLKKAILGGRFGKLILAQSNVFWQRPQKYYDDAPWRGTVQMDGGTFMNQASHYVDALYWLVGEVDSVMAQTATVLRHIETEDTGCAVLRFTNGVIGTINVTMLTYPKNYEGSVTLLGEKGTVKLGGTGLNQIEKWEFADYEDDDRLANEAMHTVVNTYGTGHARYYRNVVQTLRGECAAESDGHVGRKSLAIIEAIYESARTGKKITLRA